MYKRVYTRRWTDADLKRATEISTSIRQILRHLGLVPAGGNYAQIHKYFGLLNIDASHLKGQAWNKGLKGTSRAGVPLDKILIDGIFYQSHRLKRRLIAAESSQVIARNAAGRRGQRRATFRLKSITSMETRKITGY